MEDVMTSVELCHIVCSKLNPHYCSCHIEFSNKFSSI